MTCREELRREVKRARIRVLGLDDIKNEAQAMTGLAVVRCFGNSTDGFIYFEPVLAKSQVRPPDIVVCHPDVGVLVVEVKGHPLADIEGVEAGNLLVRYRDRIRPSNPFSQASDAMFDVRNAFLKITKNEFSAPVFNFLIAFPRISKTEWKQRRYDECLPMTHLVLKEDIEQIPNLTAKISSLVKDVLRRANKDLPIQHDHIDLVKMVYGDSAVINNHTRTFRSIDRDSLGALCDEEEIREKYLSPDQHDLSLRENFGAPRLIRGVAGSGKSVVLSNQVARLIRGHVYRERERVERNELFSQHKTLKVLVLCFNRSFVGFLKTKIAEAYRRRTLESVPDGVLQICHFNHVFYLLSSEDGSPIRYISVKQVPDAAGRAALYIRMLEAYRSASPERHDDLCFDYIFVDEGQDLEPIEYRLLLLLLRKTNGEYPITIFYDDAQNLYGVPRPNWSEIGINVVGGRTSVMAECFRNTKQTVEFAFNMLLGSAASEATPVQTRGYADLATLKEKGLVVETANRFLVHFAGRTGPKPIVSAFDSRDRELSWVASEVARLVIAESVRPHDILILSNGTESFPQLECKLKRLLPPDQVREFQHPYGGKDDVDGYLFHEDHLTLSTTFGAKGYDAFVVFLICADTFLLHDDERKETGRPSFYVGATRAKHQLYISGVLSEHRTLLDEAMQLSDLSDSRSTTTAR